MGERKEVMRPWVGLGWLAVAVWSLVAAFRMVGENNPWAFDKLLLACAAMLIAGHEASLPAATPKGGAK